jgi:hypothetical protein
VGNTCSSIHIAWRGTVDDAAKAISRSYSKLGYERVKQAPAEGGKHVVLLARAGQPYISVYDSDNAKLDSGELKDLALAATKAMKTAAVCTSLYDSDTYEFVVFANGRQVDLLMSDAESYAGPMKRLTEKSRAAKWSSLFGRTLSTDQIKQTVTHQTVFADGIIAGLGELIGLRGGQPQMNYQDLLDGGEEISTQLYFKRKPAAVSEVPTGEVRLANGYDPDDTRMLLVYPASWPVPVGKPTNVRWMILSEGAGFDGGMATILVSGPGGPVLSKGAMRGFKFHNGQIAGDLETRPTDKDHVKDYYAFEVIPIASAASESQLYGAQFHHLGIPPMTPKRTTEILILFVLYDLQFQTAGEWEINVSLQLGADRKYSYDLPPLRIAALEQGWLPVVSGLNPKTTYNRSNFSTDLRRQQDDLRELADKQSRILDDRRLIHPAIASSVAILKDAGQSTLDACKTWLEAWLAPLAEQGQGEIRIHTEKKLPPGVFKPSKTRKSLPANAFLQDKAWAALFDYEKNYQSVLISFVPRDRELAVAGIGLQYSQEETYFPDYLRPGSAHAAQMARTLSVMRGRTFTEETYSGTLHAFQWVTNDAECYEYLKTSASDMAQRLDWFAAGSAPLQAWSNQCTWVPMFDQAAHIKGTLYEDHSALNWFRGVEGGGGLYRRKMSVQWCSNVLRMLAPHMWLCRNLIDQVDRTALERVAQVSETNGVFKLALRDGCSLEELELALLPILPVEGARISVV